MLVYSLYFTASFFFLLKKLKKKKNLKTDLSFVYLDFYRFVAAVLLSDFLIQQHESFFYRKHALLVIHIGVFCEVMSFYGAFISLGCFSSLCLMAAVTQNSGDQDKCQAVMN